MSASHSKDRNRGTIPPEEKGRRAPGAGRARRSFAALAAWAAVGLTASGGGALGQERLYVQQYSPARLLAWSFDGTAFHAEDPAPGSPEAYELTYAHPQTIGGSDRWFLSGYWGPSLALSVTDPASGQELPLIRGDGGGASSFVVAPDGKKVWGAAPHLTVYDLDPASATFLQDLPGRILLPTSESHESLVANPAGDRLYLASRTIGQPESTIRVFDVSTPSAPALLGSYTVPPSAGGTGPWLSMRFVQFGGGDWLALARRDLVLVPLASGLPDLANRREWYGSYPATGWRRRVRAVWAQDTPSGPRAFAATNSYSGIEYQNELLVFDLAVPLLDGPQQIVPVTAVDAVFDNEMMELVPSLSSDYLYLLQEGGEIAARGFDQCRLRAYDLAALAAGLPGAELAAVAVDPAANVCQAMSLSVRLVPPAPPAGPAIADAVVAGALPPEERLIVNGAPRTLTITGSDLGGTTHAFLGQERLALGPVTATSVTATVPVLTPAGDPTLIVVDGSGAMAAFDGLRVVNPPQFLPGSKLYAPGSPVSRMVEVNAANANEVLSVFDTAQGPQAPAVTPDGRLMLVPGYIDGSVRVHSIVADPALGWDWNEPIQSVYAGYYPREIEVSSDGRRAYINSTICWLTVLDLEARPPVPVDTDADAGTTDFPFFDGVDPAQHALQQGISRIPMWHGGDCLVVYSSMLSPDGHWLYLASRADPGIAVVHLGAHADPDYVDPATDITYLNVSGQPQFQVVQAALAPDGSTLYWISNGENQVRVFAINPANGADLTEQAPIPLPGSGPEPWGIAVSPDGGTLYVGARATGVVYVIDLALARAGAPHVASVALPWGASQEDLVQLYEVDAGSARLRPHGSPMPAVEASRVSAVAAAEGTEAATAVTVPIGGSAGVPVPSPDGNWLYVNSASAGMIAIVDRKPGSPNLNEVVTTTGAGINLGVPTPSPGLVTPPGDPETISPSPGTSIDFSNVSGGGSTTVTSSNVSSVTVPADFQVSLPGGAPVYYDVTTSATFSGPIEVCFSYDDTGMTPQDEANVKLLHEEGGVFVDVTTSLDTVGNVVCGVVTGFSQFAQAIFTGAVVVDPPAPSRIAEPAGVATFTVRGSIAPTGSVTVPLAVTGECALAGGVAGAVLTGANYLAGVSVAIEVVDDGDPETQESCTVATGPADADDDQPVYEGYDASDVTVLVDDDDATDLAIAKSDGVAAVVPGAQLTYTISLANRGGVPVAGAEITDPLPVGTSLASSSCTGGSHCAVAAGPPVVGTVDLGPGETATFTLVVDVDAGASGDLVNTATISGSGGLVDLFPGNDSATDTTRARDTDPPGVANVGSVADTGDGTVAEGEIVEVPVTGLLVSFDEPVRAADAGNVGLYALLRSGPDQSFETAGCGPVAPEDEGVSLDAVSHAAPTAALAVNGGAPLPDGFYQLRACAGIRDVEGNGLDGDGDGNGGDDFARTFRVDTLPPTVAALGADFGPGYEPWNPGAPTNRTLYWLFVTFAEAVNAATASDPGNFHLLAEGSMPGFQTADCATGVAPEDDAIGFDGISYDGGSWTTTIDLAGPENDHLPHGTYRLLVCGSTSVEDLAGRKLDGNYDQVGGDDFVADFVVDHVAPSPPPVLFSTTHGPYTWSQLATIGMRWSGASDNGPEPATGIQGYDFVFTATGEDTDGVIDLPHGSDPHEGQSPPLPDGLWTFRIRDFDAAGNASSDLVAGPYFVDTTPPAPPALASSPSHGAGPSNDTTIDVTWPPGADNLSGLDGYGWSFTESGSWSCDQVLDGQEWVGSATSPPLAEGDWHFHLCARDNAGNWGAAASYGPWSIDTTRPGVAGIDSVAAADWTGSGATAIAAAVTRLLVTFDEAMAETGAGAVTDTANWLLVEAGADLLRDTLDCSGPGGDDVAVAVTGFGYDAGLLTAALAVGPGTGLPAGSYRLFACATLTDSAGNELDGAGDGGAAEPYLLDFAIVATPQLANPNYDDDLGGWSVAGPVPEEWSHGAEDGEGKPFSGSARLETLAGSGVSWFLEQCVDTVDPGPTRLSALVRIASGAPDAPAVRAFLTWMDGAGCTGGGLAGTGASPDLVGDTAGSWHAVAIPPFDPPPVAASFWLTFEVTGGSAESYTVEIDRALYPESFGLFGDGFESGDVCLWNETEGGASCP